MELLNKKNIINDKKEEIIISDTHGDFTSILNILNDYLNTELKFKIENNLIYNDCIIKLNDINNIKNYISINSSIIKHNDIIMNENLKFKFIKNDNLKKLNHKRLILLGDIYDPYNFRSLRVLIYDLIKLNKYNKDNKFLLDNESKNSIFNKDIYKYGNILLSSPNKLILNCMMMTYKLLICLESYMEVKYIIGNHELSSFDEYPKCIKNKILTDFKTYYYNQQRNILYCHFHVESNNKIKDNYFNLINIDDKFKEYGNKYLNIQDYNYSFKRLNSIIIHCVDSKLSNNLGNPHNLIMNNKSIFQDFINIINPIIICGHYNFKNNSIYKVNLNNEWDYNVYRNFDNNRLIYYIDCDISIFHSHNILNLNNNKKGIILNCQYINNVSNYNLLNPINIKYIKKLVDYLYFVDDDKIINIEDYNENDFNKLLIFNTFDNNIIENNFNDILYLKNSLNKNKNKNKKIEDNFIIPYNKINSDSPLFLKYLAENYNYNNYYE